MDVLYFRRLVNFSNFLPSRTEVYSYVRSVTELISEDSGSRFLAPSVTDLDWVSVTLYHLYTTENYIQNKNFK